jgi:glycosyltransferase involved in cell wall biosynthesis
MNPLVSIIIPCYNSGKYLLEAIESIENCTDSVSYEIIITDDGSTEVFTKNTLKNFEEKYHILYQENKGPAAARNTGIKQSKGDFILFLDSDNKIVSGFIDKAAKVLLQDDTIGVVYSDAYFFGESEKPRFSPKAHDFSELLYQNYIDMCSMIRKSVWISVGGLDEHKVLIGREDWDFWLRVSKADWRFHFINEKLYQYRVRKESLIDTVNRKIDQNSAREYIYAKHIDKLSILFPCIYIQSINYKNDKKKPLRSFFKYIFLNLKSKFGSHG